jgi:DNA repair protein RecO (recombination protein O)
MPSSRKVRAIVISRKKIGEADRLVTFFTKEDGLIKAVAKGVRKIPSSRGGHLEPFTSVHVLLHESRGGAYVGAVETEEYFLPLHRDDDAISRVRRNAYALLKLFEVKQPMPELFDAFLKSLQEFPKLTAGKRMLLESSLYLRMMRTSGLLPELRACAGCGKTRPADTVILSPKEGSWRCLLCHPMVPVSSHSLSPRQFALLKYIATKPHDAVRITAGEHEAIPIEKAVHLMVAHAMVQL